MTAAARTDYVPLAINADAGFPQVFRQTLANRTYRFVLYANVAEEVLDAVPDDGVITMPAPRAYMVVSVDREAGEAPARRLFKRKVVPGLEYDAYELALTFADFVVAKANINGVGAFGSAVAGGVALRWPS
jgi:hypothetical protein